MIFDTTLFEKNDVELAKQVKDLEKYFKGDEVVRLSWIDAKYIVRRSFVIIYELTQFNEYADLEHEDKNFYNYYLKLATKDFRPWHYFKIVNSANRFFANVPNAIQIRLNNERKRKMQSV
nr:MAG: hypothetical protein [Bacteriophage sp.]